MNYQIYELLTESMATRPSITEFIARLIQDYPLYSFSQESDRSDAIPAFLRSVEIDRVDSGKIAESPYILIKGWYSHDEMITDVTAISIAEAPEQTHDQRSNVWLIATHRMCDKKPELELVANNKVEEFDPRDILERLPLAFIIRPQDYTIAAGPPDQEDVITIFPSDFPTNPPIIVDRADFMRRTHKEWELQTNTITLPFGKVSALVGKILCEMLMLDEIAYFGTGSMFADKMNHHDVITYFSLLSFLGLRRAATIIAP